MDNSSLVRFAAPAVVALALAGCATPQQGHSHRGAAAGPGGNGMHAMCEMQKDMAGRSDADRSAMMEERMRSMSPEMRKQMQEMMANCHSPRPAAAGDR